MIGQFHPQPPYFPLDRKLPLGVFGPYGPVGTFSTFCGQRISPADDTAMENLARYIIRASFSQERMQYLDQEGKVVYTSKNGRTSKCFPALEWLAAMSSHIPNRGEQMVRGLPVWLSKLVPAKAGNASLTGWLVRKVSPLLKNDRRRSAFLAKRRHRPCFLMKNVP